MEIYIKKYIKSADDLPKEDGPYCVCIKYRRRLTSDNHGMAVYFFKKETARYIGSEEEWIDFVDWYLQPIELPTEEEINKAVKKLGKESTAPDKDTPDWMESDIRRGIDWLLNRLK